MIPYGRQNISEEDIQAVVDTLRSDYITTGPKVDEFEKAIANFANVEFAIAVSNGTAALHCAMYAINIRPDDEVIVPSMTFAASANCIVYCGGTPVFADVLPDSLLIDPSDVVKKITPKTRAVIAVDYAGQPCDYDALKEICNRYSLVLVTDACHSIGSEYKGRKTGSIADMTCLSFHPVKHITTGEGGMILTDNITYSQRMRCFRNHGITTDFRQREAKGAWFYEMTDLGYNYRITDFQCALGISQLKKLPEWIKRRQYIAAVYDQAFAGNSKGLKGLPLITPLRTSQDVSNAYHLYVVKFDEKVNRDKIFSELRKNGIGVNLHYIPVHFHPYYKNNFMTNPGLCPVAEKAYKQIISLPMFPAMTDADVSKVIKEVLMCSNSTEFESGN